MDHGLRLPMRPTSFEFRSSQVAYIHIAGELRDRLLVAVGPLRDNHLRIQTDIGEATCR